MGATTAMAGVTTATVVQPPVGEIIAVTTTTFTAQSYALNEAPPFGSLLRVGAYYALCYGAQTGSIEPGRHAVAWGRFEGDEEDIYRRQPQLAQVLRTTFDALLVGYDIAASETTPGDDTGPVGVPAHHGANGRAPRDYEPSGAPRGATAAMARVGDGRAGAGVVQRVPATPPRLHALVCLATPRETARFNANLAYLRFVLRAGLPLADDIIAAAILHAYEAGGGDETFLLGAARAVARLLGAEHERVMNILELLDEG